MQEKKKGIIDPLFSFCRQEVKLRKRWQSTAGEDEERSSERRQGRRGGGVWMREEGREVEEGGQQRCGGGGGGWCAAPQLLPKAGETVSVGELLLVICDDTLWVEPPRRPSRPPLSNVCMTHEVPLPHSLLIGLQR